MVEHGISKTEALHFKIKQFKNPSCDGILVGNSGLHFLNKGVDWNWHYQPDGNSRPVQGKEIEYATIFLAAFGEFVKFWNAWRLQNKPDLIQSTTNPTMAHFLIEEFKNSLSPTPGNFCTITFIMPTIYSNELLQNKLALAKKRCVQQQYSMIHAL